MLRCQRPLDRLETSLHVAEKRRSRHQSLWNGRGGDCRDCRYALEPNGSTVSSHNDAAYPSGDPSNSCLGYILLHGTTIR